jgi:cholesterol oxidase
MADFDYDVLVVGSGFGGSVTALRLTEKGYRVGVLEAGRRFADDEFPATSWDVKRFLWAPKLGCKGIQRIHVLRDVIVLAGAGVGGGSLVYANTLYEPKSDAYYRDRQWAHITDWRAELAPFYDQAKRMLGVVPNPTMTPSDEVMKAVAEEMGVGDTFGMAPVGVFFGRDGSKEPGVEVDDPYFGGAGPRRAGCLEVGECMTGCRHNAKNTLVKNYLYLAERAGAVVHPETTVGRSGPCGDGGLCGRHGADRRLAGPADGADLHRRAGRGRGRRVGHPAAAAPDEGGGGAAGPVSDRLGVLTRTNSEALVRRGHADRRGIPTSPTASRSPRRSSPTSTPTSSRSATARDPTRWGCSAPCSPTVARRVPRWQAVAQGRPATRRTAGVDLPRPPPLVGARHHRAGHAERTTTRSRVRRSGPGRAGSSCAAQQGTG